MKKAITIICTIGAMLLILDSVNAAHSLILFLFAGVIPGTNLLVSPTAMMIATSAAIVIIILRLTVWQIIRTNLARTAELRSKKAAHRAF